jgi:RNA polymerase sigma-70 factor (ECF subfamily)
MFRSEINGYHEDQEVFLKVFPPQVTVGATAVAQLEPAVPTRAVGSPWCLVCGGTQLGSAPSFAVGIPFRFDEPGRKRLLASARGGPVQGVLARSDLIVHGQLDDEIECIVGALDEYAAWSWFRDILERQREEGYTGRLDLLLSRHITGPDDAARRTAFSLLVRMHDEAMKRTAARILGRDAYAIEDAVQEASRRAWRSLRRIRPGKRFGPWMHTILVNACRDAKRRGVTVADLDPEDPQHDRALATIDARDALEGLTRGVDRDRLEMLERRHGRGESYIDIARAMNIRPDKPYQTRVTVVRREVEALLDQLRAARGRDGATGETGGIA